MLACSRRTLSCSRPTLRHIPRRGVVSARNGRPKPSLTRSAGEIPPEKRFLSIVTAFAAGFSIYFFLEDPTLAAPTSEDKKLSPRHFTLCRLMSSEEWGSNSKLLEVVIPPNLLPLANHDETFSPIWSVYIKDDDIQVERPYTPLNGIDEDGRMQFWIKKYAKGEVGRWLHSKKPGENIELRGPLKTWPWKEDTWDEVVMISGGTGITPFIQLFNTTISKLKPRSTTRFTLLHSSRSPAELPPPALLDALTTFASVHPDKFRFHVFVDEDDGSKSSAITPPLKIGRIDEKAIVQCLSSESAPVAWWKRFFSRQPVTAEPTTRIMFLVCGPEPMIGAIAGPYGRNLSQGPVGGLLERLGYNSTQVYKL